MPTLDNTLSPTDFIRWIRHALHNLYHFTELRSNPLLDCRPGMPALTPAEFQKELINSIESLKPAAGMNPHSTANRSYRILYHRYVEQFSQAEVSVDLGIGDRQLRRQEAIAVEALAALLSIQWNFQPTDGTALPSGSSAVKASPSETSQAPEESSDDHEGEIEWLKRSAALESIKLMEVMQSTLLTLAPLLDQTGVGVTTYELEELPPVLVEAASFRQALLIILTETIQGARKGGTVECSLGTFSGTNQVCIVVNAPASSEDSVPSFSEATVEVAGQLLSLSSGSLSAAPKTPGQRGLQIILPSPPSHIPILFIDDNDDTLQLFRRYLKGSRYAFLGARDQEQVFHALYHEKPAMVIMDVMMPDIDGWQMLGRLRNHPEAIGIPLVICSILPQASLAYTLGADGFMQKPVRRDHLLSFLDERVNRAVKGSG